MSKTMRAVRLFAPADVRCVEIDHPEIVNPEDVIIKVMSCGVCGSDIPRVMVKGAYRHPITIGHEFAGIVVETGKKVKSCQTGDRVTVMPLIPCGKCEYCKLGRFILCDDYLYYGSRIEGAMADYIHVSSAAVIKLPEHVDYESGSMTDPAAIALHAVNKLKIVPGQTAVVYGLGTIGFFALQWLKISGTDRVFVVDVYDEKLNLSQTLGADLCINAKRESPVEIIRDATNQRGVDFAVELAGSKNTQLQALQSVRKMGKVVLCGISYDDLTIPNKILNSILRNELTIEGAWNSSISPLPVNEWQTALRYMDEGRLKSKPLISHRIRLEECRACFEMMYNRNEVFTKVLFKPES
jgi:L-iditol 2-dehydrogenase